MLWVEDFHAYMKPGEDDPGPATAAQLDQIVAILDAGAYGAVMSSPYNARARAAEVLVDGGAWTVIRPRQPLSGLWADEIIPA